jgi:hypothetical protein
MSLLAGIGLDADVLPSYLLVTKYHEQTFLRLCWYTHCKEDPNYEFPEIKLRGLSPNFYIHISVSDLYIPTIGPSIFLQQNKQTERGNI